MEVEDALEQPNDCSQASQMKTLTAELNSLKRHFPTVKSINGEGPNSNVADIVSVVNTIKAVSAASQRKNLEDFKVNVKNDGGTCQEITISPNEGSIKSILDEGNQVKKFEPESKRVKLQCEEMNDDCQTKTDQNKSGAVVDCNELNGSKINSDCCSLKSDLATDSESFAEHEVSNKFNACSSDHDCKCAEETDLKLQIEETPEKSNDSQDSDLHGSEKKSEEDCFTPIKNHQCHIEEARTSPFLIGDKIRNSLKGIVEKVKSSPDHKRNLYSSYPDDKQEEKSYFRNDNLIAEDPVSPKCYGKMEESANKICDNKLPYNTPEMACVQSENIEKDNVTDQINHIPTDSVRLKETVSEIRKQTSDDQDLLSGIEDGIEMDMSSDNEDELLQESPSDTEMHSESVVYLGEEINEHDDKVNDLTSVKGELTSNGQHVVSGNLETNATDLQELAAVNCNTSNAQTNNSNDCSKSKQEKVGDYSILDSNETSITDPNENSKLASKSTAFDFSQKKAVNEILTNENSSNASKESCSGVNSNNSSIVSSEQTVENNVSKYEAEVLAVCEEDDIIFQRYDEPKIKKQNDGTDAGHSNEEVSELESAKMSPSVENSSTDNLSSCIENKAKSKTEQNSVPSVSSDICLIDEADLVFESSSNRNKADIELIENTSSQSNIDQKNPAAATSVHKSEKDEETDRNEEISTACLHENRTENEGIKNGSGDVDDDDDDDDDVIFEGVVKPGITVTEQSSKDCEDSKSVEDQLKLDTSKTNETSDSLSESAANESRQIEKDDSLQPEKLIVEKCDTNTDVKMSAVEENRDNNDDDDDDDVIFEGEDKPDSVKSDQAKTGLQEHTVSRLQNESKDDVTENEKTQGSEDEVLGHNKDDKTGETKMDTENSDHKSEVKSSLKRPAEANSDQNSNPKRTRLDEVIGKLGSQIGVEPESIEVSESEDDEEEESATDTAVEEKSEDTSTSDNEDDETASDSEKVKYVRITEKELEELIKERVETYLATQRETVIGQLSQKVKDLQTSNEQWKSQVKELQVKVTDVTLLNMKHEKRKAATAALKQITTRSVSVQVGEGRTASANKSPATKLEPPPVTAVNTPPHKPTAQQKSPTPMVTAPPGSNGTIRLPIPQSSLAPPVLAPQMPQLPQPAATISTAHYQTPTVKTLLDTTRQQITSGSLTKTSPASATVQYPQRVMPQGKTTYVSVPVSPTTVVVTTAVAVAGKNGAPASQITSPPGTKLKVIDLTMDDVDSRQAKMIPLPPAQMQALNTLRPVMQSPQGPQQFVLNQNGQLIQTSPVGSAGQPAFQLVFNSSNGATVRGSVPPPGTMLQAVPQQNVTALATTGTGAAGTQQILTHVPPQGLLPGQTHVRPPPTSSTQITSLLSQTKPKDSPKPPPLIEEHIRPALRKKLENTVTVPTVHVHPAPLPAMPANQPMAGLKLLPPRPSLKISRVSQGIVLSWNMTITEQYAEISSYQLFAYQEGTTPPNSALWKKVGDVKALPLPMACTLTQFQVGNKYHFAVRAVDVSNRVGQFSEFSSIHLTPMTAVSGKS